MYIQHINHSQIKVYGDPSVEMDLREEFSFMAPNYRFHPKFKAGLWNGKISMYNNGTKRMPAGLKDRVIEYFKRNDIEFELKGFDEQEVLTTKEELEEFIKSLNIHSRGNPIEVRDYQLDCILKSINSRRLVSKVPTSGGKSLIIYCIIRWLLQHELRFVLVVPNIMLVGQMYSDFEDYSTHNGFAVSENCHKLHGGEDKEFTKPVLISTWQSISAINRKKSAAEIWNTYDAVCIDEAHSASSKEIIGLLDQMVDVGFRFGTTGTVKEEASSKMTIEGHLGPIYTAITTKELIDRKQVSGIQIKTIVLKYTDAERQHVKSFDYIQEMDYIKGHTRRNNILKKLAMACEGTTLLLVQNVESHAVPLYEEIKATIGDTRPVYYVSGSVSGKEREEIRLKANTEDCIIVATFQTLSTGVNIPNIRNVIFGYPSKSLIRILQSIGRGLRLHKGKDRMILIDVVDDLKHKKKKNYAINHFEERLKIYQMEQFPINVQEIQL